MLSTVLFFAAFITQAQTSGYIEYKPAKRPETTANPISIPDFSTPARTEQPRSITSTSLLSSASPVDAYYFDSYTKKAIKIKLKVIENKYGSFIVGHKKLSDEYWTDISALPQKATKISAYDKLSEYFEYSAYLTSKTIYF